MYSTKRIILNKINFINFSVNINLEKYEKYKSFFKTNVNLVPIEFTKGDIIFFEGEEKVATIRNVKLKYKSTKDTDEGILDGKILGDSLYVKFNNNKMDKDHSKVILFKLSNLKLLTKITLLNSKSLKNSKTGNLLFKKGKNRLTATFDYKNDKFIFKQSKIRNDFLNGEIKGTITLLPFFNFDLDVDFKGINFQKFYNLISKITTNNKTNFLKVNEKINGKLDLSSEKIYSRYGLFNSFETRLQFINGNILIEQLLLNLGKLGAADITGTVNNTDKFSNLRFENNIYIDNQKRFYRKFGVYNKKKEAANIFVSGNFDLENLKMRFYEISNTEKFSEEDVEYIEKEFNDLLLDDGYKTFFDYLKLKEFLKIILTEES